MTWSPPPGATEKKNVLNPCSANAVSKTWSETDRTTAYGHHSIQNGPSKDRRVLRTESKIKGTQVSVVLMGLEEFVGPVEQELEWQEYLHVGSFLQEALVHDLGVLQLVHANGVGPRTVANGVQRVHDLYPKENRNVKYCVQHATNRSLSLSLSRSITHNSLRQADVVGRRF